MLAYVFYRRVLERAAELQRHVFHDEDLIESRVANSCPALKEKRTIRNMCLNLYISGSSCEVVFGLTPGEAPETAGGQP